MRLNSNCADKKSARVTLLIVLTCLVSPAAVERPGRRARDLSSEGSANNNVNNNNNVKNSIVIIPNFSGLDCDFDGDCLWSWDSDNFTEAASSSYGSAALVLPGQNGFYRTSSEDIGDFQRAGLKNFLGPSSDPNGSKKGKKPIFELSLLLPRGSMV